MFIKMKQKLILASVALLMMSCSAGTYYQVVDVKSSNLQKESNNYVYNDGVCKIFYNFWAEGGDAGFMIENISDEMIYVDLGNTFFIKNGVAFDYFKARSYGVGKSTQITKVKSNGISKGLSVSATAYGKWRGVGVLNGYPGSISAQSMSHASFLTSNAISEGSSSNLSFAEKPIVAIPPHASKSFYEYEIMSDVIQDCSVRLKVKKKQPEGKTFDKLESPLGFENYITYRIGENEATKVITNKFYIGGFTNYLSKDVEDYERTGCQKSVLIKMNKEAAPDRFYVKYNRTHPRDYSADAIGASVSKSKGNDMYISVRKK